MKWNPQYITKCTFHFFFPPYHPSRIISENKVGLVLFVGHMLTGYQVLNMRLPALILLFFDLCVFTSHHNFSPSFLLRSDLVLRTSVVVVVVVVVFFWFLMLTIVTVDTGISLI